MTYFGTRAKARGYKFMRWASRGLAGALLGIVRLIEATGAHTLLRSARPIVQRLRELQHPKLGWRGYDGRPLSGFMHGQSGISYALLAYDALAQEDSAQTLSESGFALEEQHFDAAQSAWPLWLDARSDVANAAANAQAAHTMIGTWCNGNLAFCWRAPRMVAKLYRKSRRICCAPRFM